MIKFAITFLIISLTLNNIVLADQIKKPSFYDDSERGWYYYESLKKKKLKEQKEQDEKQVHSPKNSPQILQQLEQVQQILEIKKAKLVLEPTIENARDFMTYQKRVFDNADQVSKVWQEALLKYPELDSRIENPVDQQAIKIKYAEDDKTESRKINEFAQHFKLILFYKSDCKYCQAFNPILKEFVLKYNFKVTGLNLSQTGLTPSGSTYGEFPVEHNRQLAEQLKIASAPMLVAVNLEHNLYIPIAQGYLPENELKRNVLLVYDNIMSANSTSAHSSITNTHNNLEIK
ncbi:MAG: hypothetical protein RIT35_756 [Pseudomonadota bacterium]|jgi:conjugal transfer pilus assembly protein TraF